MPYTEPTTTADLSLLFSSPRTLPESTDLFESNQVMTSNETDIEWEIRPEALQTMFVDEVFEPAIHLPEDEAPELTIGGERLGTFLENLVGSTEANFRDVH